MKIRKNDTVLVIAGKDRGKKGKVRLAYPKKKQLLVDFNCGQDGPEGLMRLNTLGSVRTIEETGARAGETVILYDGDDLYVEALLVERKGKLYGHFKWDDIVTIDLSREGQ